MRTGTSDLQWLPQFASLRTGRVLLLLLLASGCSCTSDIRAVPVSRVPKEILNTESKDSLVDISLLRLRQDPPQAYLLGPGDVLGVFIRGVLGTDEELPPVHYPEDGSRPPAVGYPVPVREDGTLALPFIPAMTVAGLTLVQATQLIRDAYTFPKSIVRPDQDQIIVTLIRKRMVRVMVIREESGGVQGVSKRGTGQVVDLPAYENDVLHALSATGGLPGVDAQNEVLVCRGLFAEGVDADTLLQSLCPGDCHDPCHCSPITRQTSASITRIPLRYHPSRPPMFVQKDIILGEGDIVIIRDRDAETFFTAGLLGGGEYRLPRDRDLDVLQAIATAGGPIGSVGTGVGAIGTGNAAAGGSGRRGGGSGGYCQPSEAIIIRELPCGSQISMKVDLNRALTERSERVLIQSGDVILLRYTLTEEIGNVMLNLVQFNFLFNGFGRQGF